MKFKRKTTARKESFELKELEIVKQIQQKGLADFEGGDVYGNGANTYGQLFSISKKSY